MMLALSGSLILSSTALGHVPTVEPADATPGHTMVIPGPEVSRAVYGYLTAEGFGDVYAFTVSDATTVAISLLVPAWDVHSDFRPELYIQPSGRRPVHVQRPEHLSEPEFEPFSLMSFWRGPSENISLGAGSRHLVRVDPGIGANQTGRYVLTIGGPEDLGETAPSLALLPRIWFGAWGGAPVYPNPLAISLLALLALSPLAIALLLRRGKSKW